MQYMPHDKPIKEILDDGEKGPALLETDIGDIRDPFLVGSASQKVSLQHIGVVVMVSAEFFHFAVGVRLAGTGTKVKLAHQSQDRLRVDPQSIVDNAKTSIKAG